VAGFELLPAPEAEKRLAARGEAAAVAHQMALLASASALQASGRSVFLRTSAAVLQRPAFIAAAAPGLMLLVDGLADVPAEAQATLRAKGVLIGVPDGPPQASPPVDFVAMQAGAGGIDTLLLSAQRWREMLPKVQAVGLGFAHLEDMETALRRGFNLVGGHLGRSRTAPAPRPLGAAAHRVCELLNHLALDKPTEVIGEAVRGDAALSYRLLRYANSAAIGLPRGVEAVDEAVLMLGRTELYRWLTVQLMSAGAVRQAAPALEEDALVRGRLLEAVARARQEANPGAHFTLGLLSLIEPLMQVPLAQALAPLRLGDAARDALLKREGEWADRLRLLDALDDGDAAGVESLAAALGVEDALPGIVDGAWVWAAEVSAKDGKA
jgi:EAL and modified HD-GYP domain-containing signal transduction protein